MTTPQRSSGQKVVDAIFSGAPFPLVTSDQGLALSYLRDISTALDGHQARTERSLVVSNPAPTHRTVAPAYLDTAEVALNTSRIANSQVEAVQALEDIYDSQRTLVEVTRQLNPTYYLAQWHADPDVADLAATLTDTRR